MTEEIEATGHTWDEDYTVDKEATCTEEGSKSIHCGSCDATKDVTVIEKADHDYQIETIEPTCTEDGNTYGICIVCGIDYDALIPATGHTYGDWIVDTEAACEAEGSKHQECTVCGDTVTEAIEATGHAWDEDYTVDKEATCMEEGSQSIHCGSCDATKDVTVIEKADHDYQIETTEPTCTEDGNTYGVCSVCGISYDASIPATGHTWNTDYTVDKEATCTEEGSKSIHCGNCDATKDVTVIEATGHTEVVDEAVAATCETAGKTEGSHCSVCNETLVAQEVIPATGHTEVTDAAVEPTCTATGLTEGSHCSVCNTVLKAQETVVATGHQYGEWKIVTVATCTSEGKQEHACTACGNKENKSIAATGHTAVIDAAVAATCTTAGKTAGSHCSVCNTVLKAQETVAATGHQYGSWKTVTAATCTTAGKQQRACTVCGHTESQTIAKLGHNYSTTWTVDKQATTTANGSKSHHCTRCDATKDTTTIYKIKTVKLSAVKYVYNGKMKTPTVVIKDSKGNKIATTNYTVKKATGRKNVGKYTYKITFKNQYKGTKTLTFTINPKATTIKKPTAAKKALTAKWTKISKQATGYEIMVATNAKFTKNKKTVTVKSYKTTSKKITGLKSKKTYYVKVRTYKTVNGKKYYSAWSKAKTVKTK